MGGGADLDGHGSVNAISAAAAWSFFLFGYDTGVVSTAMTWTKHSLGLNNVQYEVAIGVTTCVAGFAALGARTSNAYVGRRGTVLLASACFFLGALVVGSVPDNDAGGFYLLCLGRVGIGLGCGLATVTVPVYIAEVAPPETRGTLIAMEIFFTVLGQLFSCVVNAALETAGSTDWRLSMGGAAAPAAVLFGLFSYLPESPRWLAAKGRTLEARLVLARVRDADSDGERVDRELKAIEAEIAAARDEMAILPLAAHAYASSKPLFRAMVVGCGLMVLQQLAGINTIMYYSTVIFEKVGFSNLQSAWLACCCAAMQGLGIACVVGFSWADVHGRRKVLIASTLLVALSLYGFAAFYDASIWTACACIMLYLFFFGAGLAPVPWAVNAEIYPLYARSGAMALACFLCWETNFLISVTYLTLSNALGVPLLFSIYGTITLAGAACVYVYLPETAGKPIEEVFAAFKHPNVIAARENFLSSATADDAGLAPQAPAGGVI